jgi:hypothetical protein
MRFAIGFDEKTVLYYNLSPTPERLAKISVVGLCDGGDDFTDTANCAEEYGTLDYCGTDTDMFFDTYECSKKNRPKMMAVWRDWLVKNGCGPGEILTMNYKKYVKAYME